MKFLLLALVAFASTTLLANDQTRTFQMHYGQEVVLDRIDLNSLRNKEIILIPGIVSESFYWEDDRSILDFAFIFQNYFGAQKKHYEKLGLSVTRLWGSSKDVNETIAEIQKKVSSVGSKKIIFITHSLGGLALLDWMMNQPEKTRQQVEGIVFLQSPFYGSPIASVYFENPYFARTLLGPIMPFVNASEETVKYLSVENRQTVMKKYEGRLKEALQFTKVITMSGTVGSKSIFKPSVDIMAHGCVSYILNKCRSKIVWKGPLDESDGMVPFNHSLLEGIDFVKLDQVDHGETVLQMPFNSIDRVKMTDALIKMIL